MRIPRSGQGSLGFRGGNTLVFFHGAFGGAGCVCTFRTLRPLHQGVARNALASSGGWGPPLGEKRQVVFITCQGVPPYLCIKCAQEGKRYV